MACARVFRLTPLRFMHVISRGWSEPEPPPYSILSESNRVWSKGKGEVENLHLASRPHRIYVGRTGST